MTTQDQEQQNAQVDHADEIDIGQLIGLLIDRWLIIAGVTALFLIGGVYYALSAVSIYQADALVQVEEEQQGLDVAAMLGGDLGSTGSSTKAEIEIIQSLRALEEATEAQRRTGTGSRSLDLHPEAPTRGDCVERPRHASMGSCHRPSVGSVRGRS